MTLTEFLRTQTEVAELCVIRENGYIVATVWVDCEDLFMVHSSLANKEVKGNEWGYINVTGKSGIEHKVPCHFLDI